MKRRPERQLTLRSPLDGIDTEPRWFCEYCQRECRGDKLIYGVSLCFLCIAEIAERPDRAHHCECRLYVLEKELEAAKRLISRLTAGLEER